MLKRITMFGTAMALLATPLAAQQTDDGAAGNGNAADAAAGADMAADAFARAEAAGIPTSLLESKIAEGQAKGVAMARIEAAVEQRTDALIQAKEAFTLAGAENVDATDLSVGADAIQGGVSADVLQTISESAPQERRTVAIAALTQLVAQGHVGEDALATVQTALDNGPEALANLAADVGVDASAGGSVGIGADAAGAGVGVNGAAAGNAEAGAGAAGDAPVDVGVDLP